MGVMKESLSPWISIPSGIYSLARPMIGGSKKVRHIKNPGLSYVFVDRSVILWAFSKHLPVEGGDSDKEEEDEYNEILVERAKQMAKLALGDNFDEIEVKLEFEFMKILLTNHIPFGVGDGHPQSVAPTLCPTQTEAARPRSPGLESVLVILSRIPVHLISWRGKIT